MMRRWEEVAEGQNFEVNSNGTPLSMAILRPNPGKFVNLSGHKTGGKKLHCYMLEPQLKLFAASHDCESIRISSRGQTNVC